MIWLLTFLVPIALALVMPWLRAGADARGGLLALAALPAIIVAWFSPDAHAVRVEVLLLGADFGLDPFRRILLAFTSVLWAAAGWHAGRYFANDPLRKQFDSFFLFAMAGNFGILVAADAVTFYGFFVVMTLSVHGLIMHDRSREAVRAALVYWVMAIGGEVLLLGALLLAVHEASSLALADLGPAVAAAAHRDLIIGLAFAGFGVKAGILPLYFWLPLAHTVAPTPASAVLSGAMLKAGIVGWVQVLPLGHVSLPGWSALVIGVGVSGAFAGAALGFLQSHRKTILAYSSVSQMGVMTALLGLGLATPGMWRAVLPVLALYACVHGLAKGALFLESAEIQWQAGTSRTLAVIAILPALVIAGAPPTGGFAVKHAFKKLSLELDGFWGVALPVLLPLASLATTLVLGRFLWACAGGGMKRRPAAHPATMLLVLAALAVPFVANRVFEAGIGFPKAAWPVWRDALLPVLAGAAVIVWMWRRYKAPGWSEPLVPPGDGVVPVEALVRRLAALARNRRLLRLPEEALNIVHLSDRIIALEETHKWVDRTETRLETWIWVGIFFLFLLLLLIVILLML